MVVPQITWLWLCGSVHASSALFNSHYNHHDEQAVLPQIPLGTIAQDEVNFRPARVEDADGMATVLIDAFRPSAMFKYIYLDDPRYPNYTHTCMARRFREALEDPSGNTTARVITVPAESAGTPGLEQDEKVVSMGLWQKLVPAKNNSVLLEWLQTSGNAESRPSSRAVEGEEIDCSLKLDLNSTRLDDLTAQRKSGRNYFENVTEPEWELVLLATHPSWDGHGFGARQVQHGLRRAAKEDLPVVLMATPAGFPLYQSLGFASVENVTLTMLDGLGQLWHEYMVWTPSAGSE